jgi:hypothetical protein
VKPRNWKIIASLIGLLILFYCFWSYKYSTTLNKPISVKNSAQAIAEATKKLHHGDIVFRRGADAISDMFVRMNQRDKSYSHCGIYLVQNDSGFVYHSIGGEDNPDAVFLKETFAAFVNPKNNISFGIYQLPFSTSELHRLDSLVTQWHALHYTFDMDFSLTNNGQKMYCVEFVVKAIEAAKQDSTYFTRSKVVAKNFVYVAPDDVMLNQNIKKIIGVSYK